MSMSLFLFILNLLPKYPVKPAYVAPNNKTTKMNNT